MSKMNKTAWGILLKLIIAVATSVAGVIGITSCIGGWENRERSKFNCRSLFRHPGGQRHNGTRHRQLSPGTRLQQLGLSLLCPQGRFDRENA